MDPAALSAKDELAVEKTTEVTTTDVMTAIVETSRLGDSLHAALEIMWEQDCGSVPVVDEHGRPIAMITDRDIAMAFRARRGLSVGSTVLTAMSPAIRVCRAQQPIREALAIMREHRVRRLAVVDDSGVLVGMLTLSDIAQYLRLRDAWVDLIEAVETLLAITRPRRKPS